MKRLNRLNEIEKFWKCKDRDMQWDQILDEHFTGARCFSNSKRLKDVENDLQGDGYSFWSWGYREEAVFGSEDWDWILLQWLEIWYSMEEECEAPFLVNENAMAVCIADVHLAKGFTLLFRPEDSSFLGMENPDRIRSSPAKSDNSVICAKSKAEGLSVLNTSDNE